MLGLLAALPIFSLLHLAFASADGITVYPRLITRVKRESHLAEGPAGELQVHLNLGSKPLHLLLAENQALSLGYGVIEWVHPNGSVTTEPIVNALRTRKRSSRGEEESGTEAGRCFYSGAVKGEKSSLVAVNVCGGLAGVIQLSKEGFSIQPIKKDKGIEGAHIVVRLPSHANLTNPEGDEDMFTWYEVGLPSRDSRLRQHVRLIWTRTLLQLIAWPALRTPAMLQSESGRSDLLLYQSILYQVDSAAARRKSERRQNGHTVCNGPYCEFYRAIYGDPTLGANLKFVILRMIFYEGTSLPQIVEDNATVSLENVNEWNHGIWNALPRDERHDVAVWLTRLNIGGPSGYAPVSGACDPERSCSLNRDEGLSSAFILAHELGHILGLSHDGDLGAGNSCKKESGEGSVMAPMVAATFSYFHWSSCSAGEYHYKSDEWKCLRNKPKKGGNYTLITEKIEYEYSLDDQCGMEFDRGFSFCRSFQLPDPCEHLWCAHQDSPQLCKTKKGPPMDGTACGKEKWCVNGHCESTSKNIGRSDGLKHNSLDGSWGSWSRCRPNNRASGIVDRYGAAVLAHVGLGSALGVGLATTQDQPTEARWHVGEGITHVPFLQACRGKNEEFKLCNINRCIKGGDVRAEQCQSEFYMASTRGDQSEGGRTEAAEWLPYEAVDPEHKCKLSCFNRIKQSYYTTPENVLDGTPCSYDHPSDLCVQGKCVRVGCDRILGSPLQEDMCGICGGDGTKCAIQVSPHFPPSHAIDVQVRTLRKRINRDFSKVMVVPRGARRIEVTSNSTKVHLVLKERKTGLIFLNASQYHTRYERVAEGTKFSFARTGSTQLVKGRGPLLGAILVGVTGDQGKEGEIMVKYITERVEETHSNRQRYEWQIKGWSRCSRECGGGTRHLVTRCYHPVTGQRIRNRLCGPKRSRPGRREKKRCNTFSCDMEWVAGDWEPCTTSCGKDGTRQREVYCLPRDAPKTDQLWLNMRDTRHCGHLIKPPAEEECARHPCPSFWQETGWSNCTAVGSEQNSVYCQGSRHLSYHCPATRQHLCGPRPPPHVASCHAQGCPEPICVADQSVLCSDQALLRYCSIPSYRAKCCKSCSQ